MPVRLTRSTHPHGHLLGNLNVSGAARYQWPTERACRGRHAGPGTREAGTARWPLLSPRPAGSSRLSTSPSSRSSGWTNSSCRTHPILRHAGLGVFTLDRVGNVRDRLGGAGPSKMWTKQVDAADPVRFRARSRACRCRSRSEVNPTLIYIACSFRGRCARRRGGVAGSRAGAVLSSPSLSFSSHLSIIPVLEQAREGRKRTRSIPFGTPFARGVEVRRVGAVRRVVVLRGAGRRGMMRAWQRRTRELTVSDIRGMKRLRRVAGLLSFLHDAGCDRDKAGNRELHFDDYVLLVLLYLFNPLIDSMRTLQKVADLPEVRRRLGDQTLQPRQLQRELPRLRAGDAPGGGGPAGGGPAAGRAARAAVGPARHAHAGGLDRHRHAVHGGRGDVPAAGRRPALATPGGCICSSTWTTTSRRNGRSPTRATPAGATRRASCGASSRPATPT